MSADGSLLKRRQLGGELRRLRGPRKLKDVAGELRRSSAWLSRIEKGQEGATLRPAELREMLRIYGISDEQSVSQLMNLLNASAERDWWEPYKSVLPSGLDTFVGLESEARKELAFELAIVPGLLQTEAYARAMFAADHSRGAEATDKLVAMRLERQRALSRETDPLELHAILDESVLHHLIGGPAVMRAQAAHLLTIAAWPNVTIQILPLGLGAHSGLAGAFSLLSFDDTPDQGIVYVDSQGGNIYLEKPHDVGRFRQGFDELSSSARSPEESNTLLARIAKDYAQ
jgi:transcriptional regulator with XRE-family HTH domain